MVGLERSRLANLIPAASPVWYAKEPEAGAAERVSWQTATDGRMTLNYLPILSSGRTASSALPAGHFEVTNERALFGVAAPIADRRAVDGTEVKFEVDDG